MQFLDWGFSLEATEMLQFGIKGVHYDNWDVERRIIYRTEDQAKASTSVASKYLAFTNTWLGEVVSPPPSVRNDQDLEYYEKYNAHYDSTTETKVYKAYVYPGYVAFLSQQPDLIKELEKKETEYIVGKIDKTEFVNFLETQWYPASADWEKDYLEIMSEN